MTGGEGIGVGFIGTGWMARVHAHALHSLNHLGVLERPVRLKAMVGSDPGRTERVAREMGFERATDSHAELVEDGDIDIVANLTLNDRHEEPSIAALRAGKAVLCEKPLGRNAGEAGRMVAAAGASKRPNVCAFNYRSVPAARLARRLIDEGRIGVVRQFRASYLQDWASGDEARSGWRFSADAASGAVNDYSHIVDMMCWLAGEPSELSASTFALTAGGAGLRADPAPGDEDGYGAVLRLADGAAATLEASRVAEGNKGRNTFEVNGSAGSLAWNMEDLNRLHLYESADKGVAGFKNVLVTGPDHPFMEMWWGPGHVLGWEHTFIHEWLDLLTSLDDWDSRPPDLPTFRDGHRAAVVCDAILASAQAGRRLAVEMT